MKKFLVYLSIFVLALVACTARQGSSVLPTVPGSGSPMSVNNNGQQAFIYAAVDQNLLVFSQTGVPVNTMPQAASTWGVAVNHEGDVFVAVHSGLVQEYSRGAANFVRTITNKISQPTGLAIDSADNLYVGNNNSQGSYISEYSSATGALINEFNLVPGYQVDGVAVDNNGHVFVNVYRGPVSLIEEFINGRWTGRHIHGEDTPAGLAIGAVNRVTAGEANFIVTYKRPNSNKPGLWKEASYKIMSSTSTVRNLTFGQDGHLYVPLFDPADHSQSCIEVLDANLNVLSTIIVNGNIFGVAEG